MSNNSLAKLIFTAFMWIATAIAAFVSSEVMDVVVKNRGQIGTLAVGEGFRMEDSGLMSARGGNPLSSVLSPVSASDNGDDWEQLISYGGSRL